MQRRLPPGVPWVLRGACTFPVGACMRGVRACQARIATLRPGTLLLVWATCASCLLTTTRMLALNQQEH